MSNANPHLAQPPLVYGCAPREAALAVILVHGRGQSPEWMHDAVVGRFGRGDLVWHAPAAAGQSWYPQRFIAPLDDNEPDLSHALAGLDTLSSALCEQGFPYESQVLMGFSQGACLCSEFVWRARRRYGALVAFTGGLIGPPGMRRDSGHHAFEDMPVLLSSWDDDPHVPAQSVRETAQHFADAGAHVTLKIDAGIEHGIRDAEIGYARTLLTGRQP
ncbi:alpha/beta hydrolase [Paraburkholderia silviterrae]|uniref:Phospholipase n=1 Tax=Paraburkholderia silviterrae TaxID=2528715 RepID=A0A4R5M182_9BURK|nr:phospholipase [Paraburkholderia silviterrae]TDG18890.1 phospholipase [Paraburkholderia silviterrae]